MRLIPTLLTGPAFVVVAAFVDSPYRELLWLAGGLIDFGGPIICGMEGWKVAPSYFVERHGNIIIALGESIVQVGAGAHGDVTQPSLLVGISFGVLIDAVAVVPLAITAPSLATLVTLTAVCALRSGWEISRQPG